MRIEIIPESKPEIARNNPVITKACRENDIEQQVLENPAKVLDIICRQKGARWIFQQLEPLFQQMDEYTGKGPQQ